MGDRPSPKCPCPDCRSALKAQGVASTRDRVDAGMVARATDWCADKQNQKARTATFQNIDRVFGLCLDTTPLIKEKPLFIELTSEATSFVGWSVLRTCTVSSKWRIGLAMCRAG